jgi:putative DNA primase/helicase
VNDTPARGVLTFSDAVAAIDGKGPSKSGWYNGHCPAHDDSTASLGIKESPERTDGTFAIKCQAGCSPAQVISALEQKTGKRFGMEKKKGKENRPPVERGITLKQYATMKKLPINFLTLCGTEERLYEGKPAVAHIYRDECNRTVGWKLRLSADSHDTVWVQHEKSVPYGLHVLQHYLDHRNKEKDNLLNSLVICEGESDTQTLLLNGIPAIGISGKTGWNPEFAKLPQLQYVKHVGIVQEPDAEDFVKRVAPSFPDKRVYVIKMTEKAKDPSEMWLQSEVEFSAAWRRAINAAELINDGFVNTDTGNAERLVDMYGGNFRWIEDEGTFCAWDKTVWQKERSGDVLLPLTKEVVRAIPNDKWRRASESAPKRRAMIQMTKGELNALARRDVFDGHPMLLNVANGTLDLEKQELRDFCREDFLTKKAPVTYEIFADCPKFDEFMDSTFGGDEESIHFMDKALGYTLTGEVSESVFFICYGLGANGKTTLIETMMQILGPDFARPAKFSTFVSSKMHDPKYELATFKGTRLITAVEPRKAGHLDEEVLKQVTGGDQIMARDIYQKNIIYYPEFKLWLAMNNQPRIVGTDEGIWRRVRIIPFMQTVPEARKVKDFHKVLFAEEGSGILNRLLRGLKAWREEGLKMPAKFSKATENFRRAQDVIQGFFDAHTSSGKRSLNVKAGDLYGAYRNWAKDQDEYVMRSNEFAEELERRGFEKRRSHEGYCWWGITLKASPNESEPGLGFEDGADA